MSRNKRKQKRKSKKNRKPKKQLKDITLPVECQVPKCQRCSKEKAYYVCTRCKVSFCKNCEDKVHTDFTKELHKKETKRVNEMRKIGIKRDLCQEHNKKLKLFCEDESKLICMECYDNCQQKKHSIISLKSGAKKLINDIQLIINEVIKSKKTNKQNIESMMEKKEKLQKLIKKNSEKIINDTEKLKLRIEEGKKQHLQLLKTINQDIEQKFSEMIKKETKEMKRKNKNLNDYKIIKELKKKNKKIQLINKSMDLLNDTKNMDLNNKKDSKLVKGEVNPKRKQNNSESTDGFEDATEYRNSDLEKPNNQIQISRKFNLEMKLRMKLTNKKNTVINTFSEWGVIYSKKKYTSGKHKIVIRIDNFPNSPMENNSIYLGVFDTSKRRDLINGAEWAGSFYYRTFWCYWNKKKLSMNRKFVTKLETEKIDKHLQNGDTFTIKLNMNSKKIFFKINNFDLGLAFDNLPDSVNFFVYLSSQEGKEKNQITWI
ncbi:tripartite motif-containing protein [Anaeramoeba flamelloides]|uniref:Tripartite motif-containing protein n=1 Tax=Anaeramoeba flamelloides TaxID=1746091 RepID=A0ABQ8X1D7_9EUKA|nr:tripartite motif-containing protein [Anaeramoeba flamelloides]